MKERQVLIGWNTVGYLEQSRENTHYNEHHFANSKIALYSMEQHADS